MEKTLETYKKISKDVRSIIDSYLKIENDESDLLDNQIKYDDFKEKNFIKHLEKFDAVTEDRNDENYICICDIAEELKQKIATQFEEKKKTKQLYNLNYYIIVSSFKDKYELTNFKLPNSKQCKHSIYVFFTHIMDINQKYQISLREKISNSITFNGTYKNEKNKECIIHSELYAVKLIDLVSIYNDYGDDLFKENVRFHINTKKYSNVDNGIEQTLISEPDMFWLYHNGITMLLTEDCIDRSKKEAIGITPKDSISIINGAQTIFTVASFIYKLNNNIDFYDLKIEDLPVIKNKINNATVLLRIIINENKDKEKNNKITINLNSQKPVGLEDILYFEEQIQNINRTFPDKVRIIRNGENNDSKSILMMDLFKSYTIIKLQKPGIARSNKNKLLEYQLIWDALDFSEEEDINEWFDNNIKIILEASNKIKKIQTYEKNTKVQWEKDILKNGKEFCLAYYYWTRKKEVDKKSNFIKTFKMDNNENFETSIKDILNKIHVQMKKDDFSSNYCKLDSNYENLKNTLDTIK